MADVRQVILAGSYTAAENQYGREAVVTELSEMCGDDLADRALMAADALGYVRSAQLAARVVLCSGSYGERARQLARTYNSDPGL